LNGRGTLDVGGCNGVHGRKITDGDGRPHGPVGNMRRAGGEGKEDLLRWRFAAPAGADGGGAARGNLWRPGAFSGGASRRTWRRAG
jgi:hypothetical protein